MNATIMAQLDSLRAHLADFELPELYSVHLSANEPTMSAQLATHQPPQIATGLLTWADTLTQVTIEAWRVPRCDSVHLLVTGQLAKGVTICVYSGASFTPRGIGADLAPGGRKTVSRAALSHLATPGQVTL